MRRLSSFIVILISVLLTMSIYGSEVSSKTKREKLKLESEAGVKFKPDFYRAAQENSPTVIILPGLSSRKDPYKKLSTELAEAGFNVLTLTYTKLNRVPKSARHREKKKALEKRGGCIGLVQNEVATALKYLSSQPSVDPDRIGIVGGSLGNWVGLLSVKEFPQIKYLVMISPLCGESGKTYQTYEKMDELAAAFGSRHLFLIGSSEDRFSSKYPSAVEKSEYLISIMPRAKVETKYYPGKSHSFRMLKEHNDLISLIVQWIQKVS